MSSENIVEVRLLGAVIFALAYDAHAKQFAIKAQAGVGIANHNRSMVDSEEKIARSAMPLCCALPGRKLQDFKRVAIGILEIEPADAGGVLIPVRQRCGPEEACSTLFSRSRA